MRYNLPPVLQGIAIERHRYTEEAVRHTRQWIRDQGLEPDSHAAHQRDIYQPGIYGGFMWPYVTKEDLYVLSDLTGWFSCIDDVADEDLSRDPEALEQLLGEIYSAAFDDAVVPDCPLAAGLADIVRRAGSGMSRQWMHRLARQYSSYLNPCLLAAMHRVEGTQPAIQDFEAIWRNAGGFQVCLEFTYFATKTHLPAAIYYSTVWRELCRVTLNLLKAVNDLLSFSIMENPDEDLYNLVTHIKHHRRCSSDEAATEVCAFIEDWVAGFAEQRMRLPGWLERFCADEASRAQTLRCAEALEIMCHGNIGWHLSVPRYRETRFWQ